MSAAAGLWPLRVEDTGQPPVVSLDEALELSRADRHVDGPYIQGSLALDLSPRVPSVPTARDRGADLPDPAPWAHRLGLAAAEALVGLRPPTQLVRWTTPEVYAVVARRALTVARRQLTGVQPNVRRPRILVRRVHICIPAEGVAEAAVVLQDGARVRAMALRLVGADGRWRIAALHIG